MEKIKVINPVTNETVGEIENMTPAQVDDVLARAKKGKEEWNSIKQYERIQVFRRFIARIDEIRNDIAPMLSAENGKTMAIAEREFNVLQSCIEGYCDKMSQLYGISLPIGNENFRGPSDLLFTTREPLGVVACLLPFNYPIVLFGHKVVPALVAGNAAVVKPPTDCPLSVMKLVEYFYECGMPKNTLQIVTGRGGDVGDYLVSHPGIQAVSLTGSEKVGVHIAELAAKNLTHVFLELGGNDAFVVLKDADVDLAVQQALERTKNAGQTCCASKRYIIAKEVIGEFTDKLVAALKKVKYGDPKDPTVDMGSLISEKAAIETEEFVKHTVEQGAVCVLGGKHDGAFFPPTVITGVTKDMDVASDLEIFAPVWPIIQCENAQDALDIANKSRYGLMGAVFTRNYKLGLSMMSKMQCGGVVLNGTSDFRMSAMPFGGFKKSGIGREGISHTLYEMTQEKSYALKNVLDIANENSFLDF